LKVLLLNPPNENEIQAANPEFVEKKRGHNPPLGILYVAAHAAKHTDADIRVIDAQVEELSYDDLKAAIEREGPDIVGMTVMTFSLIDVAKTIKLVKETVPECAVIVGGPHAHMFPRETVEALGVDYVVRGEGERTFTEMLKAWGRADYVRRIPGLVFKDDGEIVDTGPPVRIDDLDALPFPKRDATPYQSYTSLLAKRLPITTMITSRGCPYRCTFCNRPHLGKKFRPRSPRNVVDEMEECVRMGIKEILVYDDTFTMDRQRAMEICDGIIQRKLDLYWDIRTRVDRVDKELLEKLRDANCQRIHYGVETGTERMLRVIRKGYTLDQVRQAFRWTREVGITTLAYFMIGLPGETREEIEQTFAVAREIEPDFMLLSILCPYPNTEVFGDAAEKGLVDGDLWREFALHPTPDFRAPQCNGVLSLEELQDLLQKGYRSFYGRPKYVVKQLLKIRSFRELATKVSGGIRCLLRPGKAAPE